MDSTSQAQAHSILQSIRHKPSKIAWAWTTLLEIEDGVSVSPREISYRQINQHHEFIKALSLPTTDARGVLKTPYRGVPVLGIDVDVSDDFDIEDVLYVEVNAVRQAALNAGIRWPASTTDRNSAVAQTAQVSVTFSASKRNGSDKSLSDHIDEVITQESSAFGEAWLALARIASDAVPPFTGKTDRNGLEYINPVSLEKARYTRDALRKKIERAKNKN